LTRRTQKIYASLKVTKEEEEMIRKREEDLGLRKKYHRKKSN
jgi:hypothetical protein